MKKPNRTGTTGSGNRDLAVGLFAVGMLIVSCLVAGLNSLRSATALYEHLGRMEQHSQREQEHYQKVEAFHRMEARNLAALLNQQERATEIARRSGDQLKALESRLQRLLATLEGEE